MRLEGGQLTDIKPNVVSRPNIKSLLLLLAFVFLSIHNSWEQLQNKQIAGRKHCKPIQPNPPYPFQTFFTPPRHLIKNRYSAKCTFLQRCELNRVFTNSLPSACRSCLLGCLQFSSDHKTAICSVLAIIFVCPSCLFVCLSTISVCPSCLSIMSVIYH